MLAELRRAAREPASALAAAGRPAIGYLCSLVPPELLLAAGLHPLRLRGLGVEDSASGDAYLSHLVCSFARHVVSAALDGAYHFLAGEVSVNSCDHIRRARDAMIAKSDLAYHGYISAPRSAREGLASWYREELKRLQGSIEDHFKIKITDQSLAAAIDQMNQVRDRLAKLDALRSGPEPRLSGADFLAAAVAARTLAPGDFVERAEALIAAVRQSEPLTGLRARVVLIGGELDDPRFVSVIEGQGAHVAGDLLCFGARGLGQKIENAEKPLPAIAAAYLGHLPCVRMMDEFPGRWQSLLDLYDRVQAQGVIFQRIKFCQLWANELHNLRHRFETERALPMLALEREYGMVSTGQIKTRVQAFLERLKV